MNTDLKNLVLFPWSEYSWFYSGFVVMIIVLILVDLGLVQKRGHKISLKESVAWFVIWVSLAFVFCVGLWLYSKATFEHSARLMAVPGFNPQAAADRVTLEFLTGYVVEMALSVDNLFVFIVIFQFFGINKLMQHRVLFYGILGALFFRALFISIGTALIQYHIVVVIFGISLIYTGFKVMFAGDAEIDPEKNRTLKFLKRWIPISAKLHGDHFFAIEKGKRVATPLFICLCMVELSDIVFAFDSVPAVLGISREPLVVFTSNVFAILGLRNMYFLLSEVVDSFWLLKYGVGIVLIFVGAKMVYLNQLFGGHFPVHVSLCIVLGLLIGSVLLSLVFKKKK